MRRHIGQTAGPAKGRVKKTAAPLLFVSQFQKKDVWEMSNIEAKRRRPGASPVQVLLFSLALLAMAAGANAQPSPLDRAADLLNQGNFAQARTALDDTPESDQTARYFFLQGKLLYLWGDYDKAIDALRKATQIKPESSEYYLWLARARGDKADCVSSFRAMFLAPKVRDAFEESVHLDPNNLDARDDLLQYYLNAPGFLGGGKDKALKLIDQIKTAFPVKYHLQMSVFEAHEKHYDKAEQQIMEAIRLQPDRLGSQLALAEFYEDRSELSKARQAYEKAVEDHPDSAGAHFDLGRFEVEKGGNLRTAVEQLQRYLQLYQEGEPYPFQGRYWLGEAYRKQQQLEKASQEFQQALDLFPAYEPARKGLESVKKAAQK